MIIEIYKIFHTVKNAVNLLTAHLGLYPADPNACYIPTCATRLPDGTYRIQE